MTKMIRALGLAAVAAGVLAAAPAMAQISYGGGGDATVTKSPRSLAAVPLPDPKRDTPGSIDTYRKMIAFGTCAARIGGGSVSNILSQPADSGSEKHDLVELQQRVDSCVRIQLPNVLSLQRGVLAEGMYQREHDKAPALPSYGAVKPEFEQFVEQEKERNHLRGKSDQVMIGATDCLVAQQPMIADKVLRSTHGTDEEASAMDSLFAYAPQCAGRVRPTNLSRSYLRAFLADSMYQYSNWMAKRDAAPTG